MGVLHSTVDGRLMIILLCGVGSQIAVTASQICLEKSSSVVENVNSRLRTYFSLRRHLGPEYLELLRFYLNHRERERSERPERRGRTPAELLTGVAHGHWLELLGFERFARAS